MTMTDAERRVLANLVNYPERAFDLAAKLLLREEDFVDPANRAAFAALIGKGVDLPEKLLALVAGGDKAWTDKEIDAFLALAPSVGEVDVHLCAFAEGVARAKAQSAIAALMSNANLPAQFLPEEMAKVSAELAERLDAINRVHSSSAPVADGDFDGTVPTPEELMDVPGFVNILADYTYRTAPRYNRVLAFAGALSMLSYLAGRKFTDRRRTMPNLYLVALAGSGCGKDHPRKVNKRLAMELNAIGGVADQIASGQGLEDSLLVNPARLFEMDEFDTLLNELKDKSRLSEGMMKYVLNFFSESGSFHSMRKKALSDHERELLATGGVAQVGDVVIPFPSLSLFATAIPEHFYRALTLRSMTNGLLARCLIFESGKRGERGMGPFDEPFPAEVLQTAQMLAARSEEKNWYANPRLTVVSDGEGVDAAFKAIRDEEDKLYRACERNKDEAGTAIWSRGVELASKLALLYAISENPAIPCISVRGVEWAWKLVRYSADRMLKMANAYVASDKDEEDVQDMLRYVRQFGKKGVNRSKIGRDLHFSCKRVDAAEKTLLDRGEIETFRGKGGAQVFRVLQK